VGSTSYALNTSLMSWRNGGPLDSFFVNHKAYRLFYESYSHPRACPSYSFTFPPQCTNVKHASESQFQEAHRSRDAIVVLGESTAYDPIGLRLCTDAGMHSSMPAREPAPEPEQGHTHSMENSRSYVDNPKLWKELVEAARNRFGGDQGTCPSPLPADY
jgi:hypothetical protein